MYISVQDSLVLFSLAMQVSHACTHVEALLLSNLLYRFTVLHLFVLLDLLSVFYYIFHDHCIVILYVEFCNLGNIHFKMVNSVHGLSSI